MATVKKTKRSVHGHGNLDHLAHGTITFHFNHQEAGQQSKRSPISRTLDCNAVYTIHPYPPLQPLLATKHSLVWIIRCRLRRNTALLSIGSVLDLSLFCLTEFQTTLFGIKVLVPVNNCQLVPIEAGKTSTNLSIAQFIAT